VGAFLCVASGKHQQWLLVAFIASFLLMISALTLRWVRWSVPVLPFLCILSAHTIDVCVRWLADKVSVRAALAAGAAVLVLMLAPLIVADARQMSEAAGVDTRTEVRQWILDNIPAGSRLLMELNGPQMPRDSYHFYYVTNAGSLVRLDTAAHMHATYRPAAGWSDELFYLKRSSDIGDAGINYIVMANWYDRYLAEKDRYPDEIARYEEIMRLGVLVHETESSAGRNRGPKIRVFQVPVAGSGN
jgi:hypothetical protein